MEKYQGKWYEIVRLPNFFQANDDRCVTATYTLKDDYVEVYNRSELPREKINDIKGKAYVQNQYNSELQVFFPGSPFGGKYWIIDLD